MASSIDGSCGRQCNICLDSIVEDNSRGKAELICGHLFHLDCIGSEFNYRGEMKCPNCRVTENGVWLLPDDESDTDDDSSVDLRRLNVHIYSHDVTRDGNSTSRRQLVVAPTIHYHENTVVLPPTARGNNARVYGDPSIVDALRRASLGPQNPDPTQRFRVAEHAVPQHIPNLEDVRHYSGFYQRSSPSSANTMSMYGRTSVPANMAWFRSIPPHHFSDARSEIIEERHANLGEATNEES